MSPEQAPARPSTGRAQRHLLARVRALRDARRRAAVHGSDGAGSDHAPTDGAPACRPQSAARRAGRSGCTDRSRDGSESGEPVRHRRGARRRVAARADRYSVHPARPFAARTAGLVRRKSVVAAVVAIALVAGAGAVVARGRSAVAPSAAAIAVLPLNPVTPDSALSRLGRELAITLSANLDGVDGIRTADALTVLAHVPMSGLPPSHADVVALARKLGASSALSGTRASLRRQRAGRSRASSGERRRSHREGVGQLRRRTTSPRSPTRRRGRCFAGSGAREAHQRRAWRRSRRVPSPR